ncbi:DUF2512 family protein [Brevibacillus sp. SYSU BS000544]|uniref:DUF2512 family protein n=1 Tax=Brevibacillus sp. SYSU BS000544 TaxID=3416443 RepID=UPI003CE4C6CA
MPLYARMGINFVYKLIVFPSILYLANLMFSQWISFQSSLPVISLSGLFLLIGIVADETILPRFGILSSTFQGFLFMTTVIWVSKWIFSSVSVTFSGALITGLMLGVVELLMHKWILKQRKKAAT